MFVSAFTKYPLVPNQPKMRYPLHCQRLSGAPIVARPDLPLAYVIVKLGTHSSLTQLDNYVEDHLNTHHISLLRSPVLREDDAWTSVARPFPSAKL
jgi:hypothetical protein